ncbi:hypothetical protein OB919_03795 [Halobacteria archaeon AArc-curdl1]|uniref:Uncharacterized protein n=1 Tax=Natronosalvus hydrolyticus TaxID=2979988 RepID=A0AAP2Z5M1_9EURY|nr:hypothetical protein [Halobacteria archaeon AArc-curdl1]
MVTVALVNAIMDDIVEMTNLFADVAMGEGLAPLLVLVGAIIIAVAGGVFGILTLGSIASLFSLD